jgi:hypothetical protein
VNERETGDEGQVLRESESNYRQLRRQVEERFASVDRGEGYEIDSDEALAAFFDELEAEVNDELAIEKKTPG